MNAVNESRSAKLSEHGAERVGGELTPVRSCRRQATESFGDLLVSDFAGFVRRLADDQLSQIRAAGDCRDASLRFEARGDDSPGVNFHGQSENVAADRICHFDAGAGVG